MSEINVTIDGKATQIESTITGEDLYRDRKEVIAYFINGQARDLYRELHDGDTVEAITIDSEMGLNILRHSCTHVMAQAVKQVRPNVKYGIGPFIENGFYYDFGVDEPFTPEDLIAIEKYMARICKEDQKFVRRVVTEDEGRAELADQPYKLELIGLKGTDSDNDQAAAGASVEVGGSELTIYDNVRKNGEVAWKDLCRGPHVPSTRLLNGVFKLMKVSAAYWRGDQANDSLQRIYGTAWATKDDLKEYVTRMEEAAKRDHRRLGNELDLFSFPEEIGSGLAVFHPKGAMVRMEMENYSRRRHLEEGYSFVYTPHVTKGQLFETSGHLEWYKDGMFPPMRVDEECDDQGNVTKEGFDYYLKPMNCPMHNLIYKSRSRSYRELPLRLFEFGTVYRYEKSGVVHGLTRGRGFTQDDSHIYCTREQMKDELTKLLTFVLDLLKDYGLDDFYLELSTKNPHKFVGSDEIWEEATNTLAEVATASGLELVPDPEGAAFYGPKISVQARDAIGRTWQMSTIQLDFNLPERFDLEYTAADGSRQRPVMIHRALFGSIERFFGVLTEHYAGAFPAWLAPVQVRLVPVAEAFNDYCEDIANRLRAENVRVEVDTTDDRFGKKIRNAAKDKIPFTLIAGGEDAEANAVSFRYRGGEQKNGVPIDQAIAEILEVIRSRRND
ncbi:threonine--tRNA ligase [Mobiluncus holmesii ATCC 35242]|uniref:Threonine--tRNA ligase n=1 Tax=Mobiluncus holmesii ATCC 35242 TaxID=887899 RepID=E6M2N4_9ACTO|nr:threonine--tRNA ligase [Mobiluncus holmesii]EFU82220.1 threonine--tRNA ligase [Mobiluncus holmesii ATCC 35242]STY88806.1 Threonine--tRNA ligase [Mobiluncus holmesii]